MYTKMQSKFGEPLKMRVFQDKPSFPYPVIQPTLQFYNKCFTDSEIKLKLCNVSSLKKVDIMRSLFTCTKIVCV